MPSTTTSMIVNLSAVNGSSKPPQPSSAQALSLHQHKVAVYGKDSGLDIVARINGLIPSTAPTNTTAARPKI